tara:strand:+ start:379 stop:537 length:159 start_codon:yes stop_codon:yes gene_type:complete
MILYTVRTFKKNRKKYYELFARKEYSHIKFVILSNKEEVESFPELVEKLINE